MYESARVFSVENAFKPWKFRNAFVFSPGFPIIPLRFIRSKHTVFQLIRIIIELTAIKRSIKYHNCLY